MRKLFKSKLSPLTKTIILKEKLKDANEEVVKAAIDVVGLLKLHDLKQEIIDLTIESEYNFKYQSECFTTLTVIGDDETASMFLKRAILEKNNFFLDFDMMTKMAGKDFLTGANNFLDSNYSLASRSGTTEDQVAFYESVLKLTLPFQNSNTVLIIKKLLKGNFDVKNDILQYINSSQKEDLLVQNPFILSFYNEYFDCLEEKDEETRANALDILCKINKDRKITEGIIKKYSKDQTITVRLRASHWARKLHIEIGQQ